MEENKEKEIKEQTKKEEKENTNKNRTIPKADVEMMREDQYERSMYNYDYD